MNKIEELQELQKLHHKKCACQLKKTAIKPIFGDGNPESKIVFIGEAPGKQEDLEGKPFVGSSGKFLAEMLATIGMTRRTSVDGARHDFAKSDIYITNTIKYRPPNNRDPLPEEKEQCKDWLYEELRYIKPALIVFLGRHAMNTFFPDLKISDAHGKLIKKTFADFPDTTHFLALYHPAAALYNGSMRNVLIKDFSKIPKILKKIEFKQT